MMNLNKTTVLVWVLCATYVTYSAAGYTDAEVALLSKLGLATSHSVEVLQSKYQQLTKSRATKGDAAALKELIDKQLDENFRKVAEETAALLAGKSQEEGVKLLTEKRIGFGSSGFRSGGGGSSFRSAVQMAVAANTLTTGVTKVILDPLLAQKKTLEDEIKRLTALLAATNTNIAGVASSLGIATPSGAGKAAVAAASGNAGAPALPDAAAIIANLKELLAAKEFAGQGLDDITAAEINGICQGLGASWDDAIAPMPLGKQAPDPGATAFCKAGLKRLKMKLGGWDKAFVDVLSNLEKKVRDLSGSASAAVVSAAQPEGPEVKLVEDMFKSDVCPLYFLAQYYADEVKKQPNMDDAVRQEKQEKTELQIQFALNQLRDIDTLDKVEAYFKFFKAFKEDKALIKKDTGKIVKIPLKRSYFQKLAKPNLPTPLLLKNPELSEKQQLPVGEIRRLVNTTPAAAAKAVAQVGFLAQVQGGAKLKTSAAGAKKSNTLSAEELYISLDEFMQKSFEPRVGLGKVFIGKGWEGTAFKDAGCSGVISSDRCSNLMEQFFKAFKEYLQGRNYILDPPDLKVFFDKSVLKFESNSDPKVIEAMNVIILQFLIYLALLGKGSPIQDGLLYSSIEKDLSDELLSAFISDISALNPPVSRAKICQKLFSLLLNPNFLKGHELVFAAGNMPPFLVFILYPQSLSGRSDVKLNRLKGSVNLGFFDKDADSKALVVPNLMHVLESATSDFPFNLDLAQFLNTQLEKATTLEVLVLAIAATKTRRYLNHDKIAPIVDEVLIFLTQNSAQLSWVALTELLTTKNVTLSEDAKKSFEAILKKLQKSGSKIEPAEVVKRTEIINYKYESLMAILASVEQDLAKNQAEFEELPKPRPLRSTMPSPISLFIEHLSVFLVDRQFEASFTDFMVDILEILKDPRLSAVKMADYIVPAIKDVDLFGLPAAAFPDKDDLLKKIDLLHETITKIFDVKKGQVFIFEWERMLADLVKDSNYGRVDAAIVALVNKHIAFIHRNMRRVEEGNPTVLAYNVSSHKQVPQFRDDIFADFIDYLDYLAPECLLPEDAFRALCCNGADPKALPRQESDYKSGTPDENFVKYVLDKNFIGKDAVLTAGVKPSSMSKDKEAYFEALTIILNRYGKDLRVARVLLENRIIMTRCLQRICAVYTSMAIGEATKAPVVAQIFSECEPSYNAANSDEVAKVELNTIKGPLRQAVSELLGKFWYWVDLQKDLRLMPVSYPDNPMAVIAPMPVPNNIDAYIEKYMEESAVTEPACAADLSFKPDLLSLIKAVHLSETFDSSGLGEYCRPVLKLKKNDTSVTTDVDLLSMDETLLKRDFIVGVSAAIDAATVFKNIATFNTLVRDFITAVKRSLLQTMSLKCDAAFAILKSKTSKPCKLGDAINIARAPVDPKLETISLLS